jgi:hypothetical protein
MASRKVGRNDPCPCGSGKKYKKCCLGKEIEPLPNRATQLGLELREALAGQEFGSLGEAQEFLDRITELRNKTPLEDFQGLSPEQMQKLLDSPFESPELIEFPAMLDAEPSAPILTLFTLLIDAIGEDGLKATAKGNLPRTFCREAAREHWGVEEYRRRTELGEIYKEDDFPDLQAARYAADFAGLVRLRSAHFRLTDKCKRILSRHGTAGIYPLLLRGYTSRLNWAYRDNYPDLDLIQYSFAYTLFLLTRFGATMRSNGEYESWFLRAFPQLLEEVDADWSYRTEGELVADCYTLRALVRFAKFLGLAQVEPVSDSIFEREYRVRKLPLLDQAVRFNLLPTVSLRS